MINSRVTLKLKEKHRQLLMSKVGALKMLTIVTFRRISTETAETKINQMHSKLNTVKYTDNSGEIGKFEDFIGRNTNMISEQQKRMEQLAQEMNRIQETNFCMVD